VVAADDVKVEVLRVGICGTDREEAGGGRALLPVGQQDLVIGHEMLGRVVGIGTAVTRVRPGDYAVFTVRRGCDRCLPCRMNRPDMCSTGDYRERGIWGLDGYQEEFVVDREQFVVRVPPELEPIGVLAEPLSVAEKAIDEAVRVQTARLPDCRATPDWLHGRRCLIAGLGPIGLLAAMALRRRGAEVYGLDVVDAASARPQWLDAIGGRYVDGRQVTADRLGDAMLHWRDLVTRLVTHRYACSDFAAAIATHPADEIKSVIDWSAAAGGAR
jgi:threonine dehydrogenase-like Zn-dependent dehydrogenase